jgi:hypothetical protein
MGLSAIGAPAAGAGALFGSRDTGQDIAQLLSGTSVSTTATDSVSISAQAYARREMMAAVDVGESLFGAGADRPYKTLGEVRQDLQADLATFESDFGEYLRLAQVDTGTPLVLQGDGKGHVNVVGEHPDEGSVNRIFSSQPQMVSRFMVMAARASLVDAEKTVPGFAQDYRGDPPAAIREHIDALEERLFGFQYRVDASGTGYSFAGRQR